MKISTIGAPVALLAAAALTLSACAANETAAPGAGGSSAASSTLSGKGSSAMSAAQQKWIADYQSAVSIPKCNVIKESLRVGIVEYEGPI